MSFLATTGEIEVFTGCSTTAAQILVLKARKVKHFVNVLDRPVVAKSVIDRAKSQKGWSSVVPPMEAIEKLPRMPRNGTGIYFLCKGDLVVYVGKTTNFFSRMSAHDGGQNDFDSVKFLPAPADRLDALEREYIAKFCPKYNKAHNRKWRADELTCQE